MTRRRPRKKKLKYNRDHPRPQLGSGASYGDFPRTIDEDIPPLIKRTDLPLELEGVDVFSMGECTVHHREDENGHYLSISHPFRYPTWDEVTEARYRLVPDGVTMAMIMPPMNEYLNIHPYMFNCHQLNVRTE